VTKIAFEHAGMPKGRDLGPVADPVRPAIAKAYNEGIFTDEINPPPTNSKRS
jgi:hypothetical protein